MSAVIIVPAILGERVGIIQIDGWLRITSACCESNLISNDSLDRDDFSFYKCVKCNGTGARRDDYSGGPLGVQIALLSAGKTRLEEWATSWLDADCIVEVER